MTNNILPQTTLFFILTQKLETRFEIQYGWQIYIQGDLVLYFFAAIGFFLTRVATYLLSLIFRN